MDIDLPKYSNTHLEELNKTFFDKSELISLRNYDHVAPNIYIRCGWCDI